MTGERRPGVIPELAVTDLEKARALLVDCLGFVRTTAASLPDRSLAEYHLGSQQILLRHDQSISVREHGLIDHIALKVGDTDRSLARLLGRGASIDREITPDGPQEIAEFWTAGVRYMFLCGPEGARLELCAKRDATEGLDGEVLGHDHIGISCRDVSAMRAFFAILGFQELASHVLERPSGGVEVCFMSLGEDIIELFSLPEVRAGLSPRTGQGRWTRLHVLGPRASDSPVHTRGPEGLDVVCW